MDYARCSEWLRALDAKVWTERRVAQWLSQADEDVRSMRR